MKTIKSIGLFLFLTPILCIEIHSVDHIVINKKNVLHKFVHFDVATDFFVESVFATWENDTFDVFDAVKNPQEIAIDLGAWIGTTAIWLSKNFYHVIAVDADPVSLKCLGMNLEASESTNVTVCARPVAVTGKRVVFGPRGNVLNESVSYIKDTKNKDYDYVVQAITFKQLIHDYIYTNENIKNHKISFIKCDIEGGEESIIEDMLYFAYYNKCKVYLSFHLDWWKQKKITDFEYLFKFFRTNCPQSNVCQYVQQNPFSSLLFEPIDNAGVLIKKNMPVVIMAYNQFTYVKNMVTQLEKYTTDIIVVDNNSHYKLLLDYYKNDFKYTLLKQNTNLGHRVWERNFVQNLVGNVFLLTDPDLQFNSRLPENFIQILINISNHFAANRVGFALSIDSDNIRTDILLMNKTIKEWESDFWKTKLSYSLDPNIELYSAPIDTTFCLVNKKFPHNNIRIAGDYTCLHLPWYIGFKEKLQPGEVEAFQQSNISTNWFK